jgi:hypothetical protein
VGPRYALLLIPAVVAVGCLVSIGDVDESPGAGGSGPDSSAGAGGSQGGAGGSWGNGGSGALASGGSSGSGGNAGSGGSGGSAGSGAGGGAAGASGAAGSAGSAACLAPIKDDFDDGVIDSQWDTYANPTSITLNEPSGTLQIALPDGAGTTLYGGVRAISYFDVTGCAVLIRAVKPPNPNAPTAYSHFALQATDTDYAEFFVGGGSLLLQRWQGGNAQTVHSEPYDPIAHAWWRIREQAGTLHFETSADGKLWKPFASTLAPFDPKGVTLAIGAGAYEVESDPGTAVFDDLNLPPP